MPEENRKQDNDVVRKGGIAPTDADASDVTRDTYGFTGATRTTDQPEDPEEAKRRARKVLGEEE